jgi:hyperosmotically inducible periplasmic protein
MLATLQRRTMSGVVALILMLSSMTALGAQPPAPDNTKVNASDRKSGQVNAEDQSNRRPDLEVTQNIRQLIAEDTSLSTYARNVKVITKRGKVSLRGPVRSEDEKATIGTKAAQVVGASNVSNRLTIAPSKDDKKPNKKDGR